MMGNRKLSDVIQKLQKLTTPEELNSQYHLLNKGRDEGTEVLDALNRLLAKSPQRKQKKRHLKKV